MEPADLAAHNCINLRLPTHGSLMQWDFEKNGHELKARVEGQWTFNSSVPILRAAVAGCGLAFLPEDMVANELAEGSLVGFWKIGASRSRATIFTIRIDVSIHPHLALWLTH